MAGTIDKGRAKAAAKRVIQAAQKLAKAKGALQEQERNRLSVQGEAQGRGAQDAHRKAQEGVSKAEEEYRKAREDAQRHLSDIRRAIPAGRQDLDTLLRGASELRTGQGGFRSGAEAQRADLQLLQSLESELQKALQTPTTGGGLDGTVGSFSSRGAPSFLTGMGGGASGPSPSMSAIEAALLGNSRNTGGSGESARSRSGFTSRPESPSRDFDPYSFADADRFNEMWGGRQGDSRRAEEEIAAQYHYYRKNNPLTVRTTYARKSLEYSVDRLHQSGHGYSGTYEG